MNIEFKFKHSLAGIFKKEIEELGFDTSKLVSDEDVIHSYCSYSYRLLEKRPRTIHKADTFVCPDEVKEGLAWLESKIKKGESLNPHLNTTIQKDKLDGLLYDWGIHHLHLGLKYETQVLLKGQGPYCLPFSDQMMCILWTSETTKVGRIRVCWKSSIKTGLSS